MYGPQNEETGPHDLPAVSQTTGDGPPHLENVKVAWLAKVSRLIPIRRLVDQPVGL